MLIIEPVVVKAAEDNGVGVSADQARTQLATWAPNAGVTDVPDYGDGTVAAPGSSWRAPRCRTCPTRRT